MNYVKSPLNYVGGKYKLLKEIIPLFPSSIDTFVDLFGGGFNVGANVQAKQVIYNDIVTPVVELLEYIKKNKIEDLLTEIDTYIDKYNLSKENRDGFLELRNDYNTNVKTPMKFYTLLCFAFNYQIRFNKQGEYNMPFGKDRSSFNPILRLKFIEFHKRLNEINCSFLNIPFNHFDYSNLNSNSFIYCDPRISIV